MPKDARGLPLTTESAAAAQAYDTAIERYCLYRADTMDWVGKSVAADPGFVMGQCLKGYLTMLGSKAALVPMAAAAHGAALAGAARATPREQAHVAALGAWIAGDYVRAFDVWEQIEAEHPHDLLAFRLSHFNLFWTGDAPRMQRQIEGVLPRWSVDLPGHGTMLAMRAFANEECGSYRVAEAAGREAQALDPRDLWAVHAVAHVLEMQGRVDDGIRWIESCAPGFGDGNQLMFHTWWHKALYHWERGESEACLELYDKGIRDLGHPLVKGVPDSYIDVQNAVGLLWRLERLGVDVGDRWGELADKAEARIGDHANLFTVPHWMMALAADGRETAADHMLHALREDAAATRSTLGSALREVVLPVTEAVRAHRRGDHATVVERLTVAQPPFTRLGGSHPQRDLFVMMLLDSALARGRSDLVRALVAEAARGRPAAPRRRQLYRQAQASL